VRLWPPQPENRPVEDTPVRSVFGARPAVATLSPGIQVAPRKCVNCHACIAACPVKICNDGSGDHVSVKPEMCIGCGRCLATCTHGARYFSDDFGRFMADVAAGIPIVAVVAPSVAANFPGQYLQLNGWLRRLGVAAVFDVSFGAELHVKSLVEELRRRQPRLAISPACPAIVSYIQVHRPRLLRHLVPVLSPMLHTMKMIERYYARFREHRIAALSPCPTKRRELDQAGLGDYHVTFRSVQEHLASTGQSLDSLPGAEYVNPPPGAAVLLPTPGGLLRALETWLPEARHRIREVHGSQAVYSYLESLPEPVETCPQSLPLLVDCLNCEHGCNCGPASVVQRELSDELQRRIEERYHAARRPSAGGPASEGPGCRAAVEPFWEEGLYGRPFQDLSAARRVLLPDDAQREAILRSMHKYTPQDLYNCCSCGYGSCEQMVVAIHNGLNRPENCHHYLAKERESSQAQLAEYHSHLESLVERRTAELLRANDRLRQEVLERWRVEKALLDSEHKLRDVVEGSPIPQFVIDRKHRVTYWNKAIEQFSGLNRREIVGTDGHWRAFYPAQRPCVADLLVDEDLEGIEKYYRGRWKKSPFLDEAYECTDFFPRLGQNGKWLYFSAALLRDARGTVVGAVETLEDITLRKVAEQKLEESQRAAQAANRAKSEFLANMSHEIRTPMTAILGYADLVLENLRRPEDIEAVQTIKRNGEHLLAVINDILDLSKVEAGALTVTHRRCAIAEIVEEVVSLMRVRAEAKNLSLRAEYRFPLPETITTDPIRLRQSLINLVGNAVQFTEAGSARVRVWLDQRPEAPPKLHFDVIDTGIGIPQEQQIRLFEPFSQGDASFNRRVGGTGLGLAISRRLAEILGGEIQLQRTSGEGSIFSLILDPGPLDGARMLSGPSQQTGDSPSPSSPPQSRVKLDCRILLAEDGPDNQRLVAFLLRKAGAEVVVVENGQLAVEAALSVQSGSGPAADPDAKPFDLVLMDMQMPVLDGYEATRQLRAAGFARPILALTAHAMADDREACLRAGCTEFISRTIDRDRLLAMVAHYSPQPASGPSTSRPAGAEGRL